MVEVDGLIKRKIVVLGSRSVGKSSLVVQFIDNYFIQTYQPLIECTCQKLMEYNGTQFDCEIMDTAGQDEYSIFNPKYVVGIHGYILVYSITSRNSFDMIQTLYDRIRDFWQTQDIPCVVVGSKADLESRRLVQPSEGEKLAERNHSAWVETSPKNNINVSQVFQLCLEEIDKCRHRNLKPDDPRGSCFVM